MITLGVNDVPWNNESADMPTLAWMANSGVVLDNAYTLPVCTPSRYSRRPCACFLVLAFFLKVNIRSHGFYLPLPLCTPSRYSQRLKRNRHSVFTSMLIHTWYLSRTPRICSCKFFLAGVNFYRFNAKNWHFRQILREKLAFFGVNLILQKFCPCKKNDKYQVCVDLRVMFEIKS